MNTNMILELYIAAEGAFMTATGTSFIGSLTGRRGVMSKYSEKSLKKFTRFQGPILIAASAFLFAFQAGMLPAALTASVAKWSVLGVAGALTLLNMAVNLKKGSHACSDTYIDED